MNKTDLNKSRRSFVKKLGASVTFIVLGNSLACSSGSSNGNSTNNDSEDDGDGENNNGDMQT